MMADQIHKTQLLEPWYAFRLELSSDNVGRAMNDIQNMGGSFDPPETGADVDKMCIRDRSGAMCAVWTASSRSCTT